MTLGLGLLGVGSMGRELARVIAASVSEARVVAAYDPYQPAREAFCGQSGAAPAASVEELLARPEVGAVLVASPNDLHCEQTVAAAEAGKHVFCEKPMALSVADCDEMIAACKRAGVKLMVGQSTRLIPIVRRLRELSTKGDLGEPLFGTATYFFSGFKQRESGVWHAERARSGGLFFHMAIHQIDLFNSVFGAARRVRYAGGHHGSQVRNFHDVASILIEFASGATGVISASSVSPVHSAEMRFIFSRGFARLDSPWSYMEYGPNSDHMARVAAEELPGPGPYELELSSFTRWVLYEEPPVLTAEEGRAAVAVAEAAERAEKSGEAALVAEG